MTRVEAVVDCSAIAAILFQEPESDALRAELRDRLLVAPSLLRFEVGNVALKRVRRGLLKLDLATKALRLFDEFEIELINCPLEPVLELAVTNGLSFYDASYLWLKLALRTDLFTLDKRLAAVAAK